MYPKSLQLMMDPRNQTSTQMSHLEVTIEPEATPLVRVLAKTLTLGLQRSETQALLASLRGVYTVKSIKGPQAATYTITHEEITLTAGRARNAKVTIETDFDDPSVKPKISGLFRHPLAALRFGKLLSLPLPNWADTAKRFYAAVQHLPDLPETLTVTNIDESRSLSFGEGGSSAEIIGTSAALESLLAGQDILVSMVMRGKLQFRGSLAHLSGLSNAGQKLLMGELDG